MAFGWTSLGRAWGWPGWKILFGAAFFVVLTRWFHLSGEWVVGGAEAKGLAFAALFLAVACAQSGRWPAAFWAAGVAAGFHVLIGGWLVVCLGVTLVWLCATAVGQRRQVRADAPRLMVALIGGALCSLPGLVPAWNLTAGVAPEINRLATEIYVLHRLPHHLALWAFGPQPLCGFSSLLVVWLLLIGCDRGPRTAAETRTVDRVMIGLVHAALGLSVIGMALSVAVSDWGAGGALGVGWLRYYWFRMADVLLPLGVVFAALSWPGADSAVAQPHPTRTFSCLRPSARRTIVIYVLVTTAIVWEGVICHHKFLVDGRPNADQASLPSDTDAQRTVAIYNHWRRACDWIRQRTEPEALFLTPRGQQTFKWYAHRSEVVSWKDVPQDSPGILEWWQRVNDCTSYWQSDYALAIQDPVLLHDLVEKYQVDYLVMPQYAYELQHRFGRTLPYRRVYPENAEQRTYYVILATRQWQK
jgi:hypothetical protein